MKINRRSLLGMAVGVVTAGAAPAVEDGGKGCKSAIANGHTFVAACPGATATIPRKAGPTRVMIIGAHPDDADIYAGCLTVKLIERGFQVKFVSITDGRMGHHRLTPLETAKTRRAETLEAARRFGLVGYDIYGEPDCGLEPTYEMRCRVAREIRSFEPDYVFTHRTCDYHPDHRATGKLVMDASYLLGVPHWVPEAKAQRRRPVIFYLSDPFTVPRELRPDFMIDAEPYLDKWCQAMDAQVSQFYDWLPWVMGMEAECQALGDRSDIKARNVYLCKYWAAAKVSNAKRFAAAWRAQYPNQPVPKYMEAYEVSEYGRAPETEDFRILLG